MGRSKIACILNISVKGLMLGLMLVIVGLTKARDPSSIFLAPGLGWVVFTIYVGILFINSGLKAKYKFNYFLVIFFLLSVFSLSFGLSLLKSEDILLSANSFLKFILFFSSIFLIFVFLKKIPRLQIFQEGFTIALLIITIHTLVSFIFPLPVADDTSTIVLNSDFYRSGRLPTVYGEPSYFGYAVLILSIGIYKLRILRNNNLGVISLFLSIPALILAGSLICLFVAIINSFLVISWRRLSINNLFTKLTLQNTTIYFTILCFILFSFYNLDFFTGRIYSIINGEDGSTKYRFNAMLLFIDNMRYINTYIMGLGFFEVKGFPSLKGFYTSSGNVIIATSGIPLLIIYTYIFFKATGLGVLYIFLYLITLNLQGEPFYPLLSFLLAVSLVLKTYEKNSRNNIRLPANRIS